MEAFMGHVKHRFAAALLAVAVLTAGAVRSAPPGFNIQGRLTDGNGVNREGNYSLKFTIYDAPTGGTAIWTKTFASLTVRNGNFQTVLGDTAGQPVLSDVFASGDSRHLEIQVLSGPGVSGPEPPLIPRQQLVSVPYALRAATVEKADVISSTAAIVFQTGGTERARIAPGGQFGVGTSTPAFALDVSGDINITGTIRRNGAPLTGASFGGMFVTQDSPTGSCLWPNPAAGGCACPAGYNDSSYQYYQPGCINCGWSAGYTVLVPGYVTWHFLHQCWR
jgi:hypothetical protein